MVRSTDHKAPRHAVLSTPLLPRPSLNVRDQVSHPYKCVISTFPAKYLADLINTRVWP